MCASAESGVPGPHDRLGPVGRLELAEHRVHLDVRAAPGLRGDERMAALERRCEELLAVGATRLSRVEADQVDQGHITMADPEGNEFCLD